MKATKNKVKTPKPVKPPKVTLQSLQTALNDDKERFRRIGVRLRDAVNCIKDPKDPNDIKAFLGQLRDLATELNP